MLHGVETGTGGKHPSGKNPLQLAGQQHLIHFHKRRGLWCLGDRPGVTNARGHLKGTKLLGLIHRHFKCRDGGSDFVQASEDGNGILDLVGTR